MWKYFKILFFYLTSYPLSPAPPPTPHKKIKINFSKFYFNTPLLPLFPYQPPPSAIKKFRNLSFKKYFKKFIFQPYPTWPPYYPPAPHPPKILIFIFIKLDYLKVGSGVGCDRISIWKLRSSLNFEVESWVESIVGSHIVWWCRVPNWLLG